MEKKKELIDNTDPSFSIVNRCNPRRLKDLMGLSPRQVGEGSGNPKFPPVPYPPFPIPFCFYTKVK